MNSAFIVGCPRSGTTLLQSMVASHTRILSFPETHFFSETLPINPLLRRLKIYGKKEASHIRSFLEKHNYPALPAVEGLSKQKYTHQSWCQKIAEILNNMAAHDADQYNHELLYWLEKTPRHLHYLSSIEQSLENPRFLHILREGKHVVASLHLATKQHPEQWDGERSINKCINWWKKDISVSLNYKDRSNHMMVVYDQLLDEPEFVINRICKFLSLDYESSMITHFHQAAGDLTTEAEHWKSRNTKQGLNRSSKLTQHFDHETINFISRKTASIDLSNFYLA